MLWLCYPREQRLRRHAGPGCAAIVFMLQGRSDWCGALFFLPLAGPGGAA